LLYVVVFRGLSRLRPPGKGNIDAGAALVGQINVDAWWIDINGNELASMTTTALFPPGSLTVAGAKSVVRLGD
jgi:hypothetical protein